MEIPLESLFNLPIKSTLFKCVSKLSEGVDGYARVHRINHKGFESLVACSSKDFLCPHCYFQQPVEKVGIRVSRGAFTFIEDFPDKDLTHVGYNAGKIKHPYNPTAFRYLGFIPIFCVKDYTNAYNTSVKINKEFISSLRKKGK